MAVEVAVGMGDVAVIVEAFVGVMPAVAAVKTPAQLSSTSSRNASSAAVELLLA